MRLFAVLLPLLCFGQDWGSLHIVNGNLSFSKKLMVQLHSRVRTNQDFREFFQARNGLIANYQIRPRLILIGGYYFLSEQNAPEKFNNFHRVFGGGQVFLPLSKDLMLESRTLTERFIGTPRDSYMRNRQRLWLTFGKRTVKPFVQAEALLQRGVPTGRFGSGIQITSRGGHNFFVGYEIRQLQSGGHIQLIATNFQFRLKSATR